MKNGKNLIDVLFTTLSITITIEDVYNILGIVLVILNIMWLTYRFVENVKNKHKNGDVKGILEDGKEYIQDLQDVRDNIKKEGDK